jgi:hypothetical protein
VVVDGDVDRTPSQSVFRRLPAGSVSWVL